MKYCQNCRCILDDSAVFCQNCGAPQYKGAASQPAAAKTTAKKKSGFKTLLILGLVFFVFYSIGNKSAKDQKDDKPTAPNKDLSSLWNSYMTNPEPTKETKPPQAETDPPKGETNTPTQGGFSYTDDRAPHYTATNPQWETLRYEWERQDKLGTLWMELPMDARMYEHYRALGRYQGVENYYKYINDANNKALVAEIVRVFRQVGKDISYSDSDLVRECANFVQETIEYQYDIDSTGVEEYPRYPIETLYERQGDCEDTSILMAALLKELGYEVGFLHIPGHVAVAIRTTDDYNAGMYYEINGHRYLYIESTATGWNIGDIPEEFQDVPATYYRIP